MTPPPSRVVTAVVVAAAAAVLLAASTTPAVAAAPAPAARADKRPNVIVILADDLGRECLGSYGSRSYQTPHLDALAAGGIRFTTAFATPLCSPTRAALMTGRYGFRTGWTQLIGRGGEDALEFFDPRKEKTFGHVLRAAGYATGIAGKWQLARFDERPDHLAECGFADHCVWTWQFGGRRTSRYWDPSIWQDGKVRTDTAGKYGPDVMADWVDWFLERNKEKPFFLYYPMVLTHGPFEPTPDSRKAGPAAGGGDAKAGGGGKAADLKAGGGKKGKRKPAAPPSGDANAAGDGKAVDPNRANAAEGAGEGAGNAVRKGGSVEDGEADGQAAEFPAMVAHMDKLVGRVTATVRRLGLEEDTLILFTADNGTPRQVVTRLATPAGDRPVRGGKGQMTDLGSHVPLIASWKGTTPAGRVSDQLVDLTDVLPTLAELAGTSPPPGVAIDGHSFAAALRGLAGPERQWVHTQLGNRRWVRDKRWKLMGTGELYDLQADPWEERPVPAGEAGDPTAAAARARLAGVLATLKG